MKRRSWVAGLMGLAFAGCDGPFDWANRGRFKDEFHYTKALSPGGTLSLDTFNSDVDAVAWDENTVEISGFKSASSKELLDALRVDIQSQPGSLVIHSIRPSSSFGSCGIRYSLHVPRTVRLDPISTSNGAVVVDGISGTVRIRTSNGSVRAQSMVGDLNAQTTNGSVDVDALTGNAVLRTSNGAIHCGVRNGSLEARTSNGPISARILTPDSNWPVRLSSSNGSIELQLDTTRPPDVNATTSNAAITVGLPSAANARVRAHTSHASIRSDFDVNNSGGPSAKDKHAVEGTIGAGGSLLQLSTSNGAIYIAKR